MLEYGLRSGVDAVTMFEIVQTVNTQWREGNETMKLGEDKTQLTVEKATLNAHHHLSSNLAS